MPRAKIVYNGAGGGGDLFAGTKFYVLQRVPSRDKWKDLITSNGGAIVLAEAQADIIIADHARAHQPIGSISWTFIEQSVKKGELEDLENHRAGPSTKVVREVGSKQPARQGRTPFTAEDDRILMEWCTKAERQGLSMRGNKLFQQLEEKNPRHTFQSWRDRWIKHLDRLPRPVLDDEEEEEGQVGEEEEHPQPVKRKQAVKDVPTRSKNPSSSAALRATSREPPLKEFKKTASVSKTSTQTGSGRRDPVIKGSVQRSNVSRESVQSDASHTGSVQRKKSPPGSSSASSSARIARRNGNIFVEEETDKLVQFHDDILTVAEDRLIDFWIQWATQNDEHTAQEWCNHFREYVVPKMKTESKSREMPPPAAKTPVRKSAPKVSSSKPVPERIMEVEDSQDNFSARPSGSNRDLKFADPYAFDERSFEEDFLVLAERLEVEADLNLIICGQPVSLFSIWKVVVSDELGGFATVNENKLWPEVASRLGFDLKRQPTASDELETRLQELENLFIEFEDLVRNAGEMEETEEDLDLHESDLLAAQLYETANHEKEPANLGDELVDIDQQEEHEHEHGDDLASPHFSSSRKQIDSTSRKRGSDSSGSSPYVKRQRVDKGKGKEREIPSTPEEEINNRQAFRPRNQPSPLKDASLPGREEDSDEDYSSHDEDLFVPANDQGSGSKRLHRPRNLEPETQDFHFPNQESAQDGDYRSPYMSSSPPPLFKNVNPSQTSNAATRGSVQSTYMEDSSTQSQPESQTQARLIEFINDVVAKGYPQEVVIRALEATTMELGPNVEKVAESLTVDEFIPNNIQGVWHPWDDDALSDGVESKEYRHILLKHGPRRIKERKKFLATLAKENEDA